MTISYTAAWVPDDDPQRPWGAAFALAAEWTIAQARSAGTTPLLVANAQQTFSHNDEVGAFARRHRATTPQSRTYSSAGAGPVVAFAPSYDTFVFAAQRARGTALCAVETTSAPLRGWAMESGAMNLWDGQTTTDQRPADLREDLERLVFYGNNAWGDNFGKQQARTVLGEIAGREQLDKDIVLGHVLAHGASVNGVRQLAKLIDSSQGQRGAGR